MDTIAEKRMFTKKITESDAFLDMPMSSQCLYFHLNMSADDEGFVNNPKRIQRYIGANDDDMKLLLAKQFIIAFESGVIVIKHWRMHNYIQNDRFNPTDYQEERAMLKIKENKAYSLGEDVLDTECIQTVSNMDTNCIQNVYTDKNSIDKNSIDIDKIKNIVDFLNQICGTNYKYSSSKTQKLINARFNEGFTVDDFKTVITKKAHDWLDNPTMVSYLRPETLFGTKFEGYLNQQESAKPKSVTGKSLAESWADA